MPGVLYASRGLMHTSQQQAHPVSRMKIFDVRLPLVQHKLGLMRRADNSTNTFRELAAEVATLLTYEATSDLETEDADVEGWAGTVRVRRIKCRKITLVPILRAGIGMLPGVLELIPAAKDRKSVV